MRDGWGLGGQGPRAVRETALEEYRASPLSCENLEDSGQGTARVGALKGDQGCSGAGPVDGKELSDRR